MFLLFFCHFQLPQPPSFPIVYRNSFPTFFLILCYIIFFINFLSLFFLPTATNFFSFLFCFVLCFCFFFLFIRLCLFFFISLVFVLFLFSRPSSPAIFLFCSPLSVIINTVEKKNNNSESKQNSPQPPFLQPHSLIIMFCTMKITPKNYYFSFCP
jgi:glucan phosphoethanolaminetransferase (alkaline phosphatase superfamily)